MQAPEYSQVGTIVEGPTEFFSGRIENAQRKKTFVEEVLAGEQETKRFKKKYGELQDKKTSGKKAYYKKLQEQRKGGVKKSGTRLKLESDLCDLDLSMLSCLTPAMLAGPSLCMTPHLTAATTRPLTTPTQSATQAPAYQLAAPLPSSNTSS